MTITITGRYTQTGKSIITNSALGAGETGLIMAGTIGAANFDTIEYVTISTGGDAAPFGTITTGVNAPTAFSNGTRAAIVGGYATSSQLTNVIEYVIITSPGAAQSFGYLRTPMNKLAGFSNGSNDRGISGGGLLAGDARTDVIDHVTISTGGNTVSFGTLSPARFVVSGASNGTNERGMFVGGRKTSDPSTVDTIEYITISTPSSAISSGSLPVVSQALSAVTNDTNDRILIAGGAGENALPLHDAITYKTITSEASAVTFGTLVAARRLLAATSNGTNERAIFTGGLTSSGAINVIEYVTISSAPGSVTTTDFGDLSRTNRSLAATSDGQA